MFEKITKIDLDEIADQSRLFRDHVSRPSGGLKRFLEPIGSRLQDIGAPARSRGKGLDQPAASCWASVIDEIEAASVRLGAAQAVVDKLALARSREARFVVTGQQPGVLGGPLYSLCLALYWCGSDDADFAEVRDVSLMTGELSVVSASISQDAHRPGMPVGAMEPSWLERVWKSVRPFTETMPGGAAAAGLVDSASMNSRSFFQSFP